MEKQLLTQPQEVKFCRRCVVSNQRPRIRFDEEGVCSACRFAYEKYHVVDWGSREAQLEQLLEKHRRKDGTWDVIVPCSGGKDSSYVAHQLKAKYGMHPLTVTWAPFRSTEIGYKNFLSFVDSGFNNLTAYPNGRFHRKLARLSLEELGDAWQPFTYGQMCYAFHIAKRFNINLIFFGENGEAEYGGDPKNNYRPYMPFEDWALLYFKGTTIDELVQFGLKHKNYLTAQDFDPSDLTFYRPPAIEQLDLTGIQMHWYSYYHKWVPQENYYYSIDHTGFCANPERSEGTYSKYASLDDRMDGFHFYMGYIKFGIGRTTSDVAHEIRDGHLTREEGVRLVRRYDGEFPSKYFAEFLAYLDIDENHFWKVAEHYRQPHLWEKINGEWKLTHQVS
ncbi:MAG: N-acetyl sugar amidotransferase [Candidatus Omnitrophica bacterium]|nr:N-acetyl sugar amidotransferase [Candidatus Omnitrophota bacterium]